MTGVLTTRDLRKQVGSPAREVLSGVDLSVGSGEVVALLGRSGAGKSTLLQILGALDPDFVGDVHIAGVSLSGLADGALAQLRRRQVGFVFQHYNLLPHLDALHNVALSARFGGGAPDLGRAHALLEQVGLKDRAHDLPVTLSGGEQQRVAVARALYASPAVLIADEPTGNLDQKTAAGVLGLFAGAAKTGCAVLIATHDTAITETASRVLRLETGRVS